MPPTIDEPLNEMLQLQKKAYTEQKEAHTARNRNLAIIAFSVVLIIGVILIGFVLYRHSQLQSTAGGPVSWGIFFEFTSWAEPCLILGAFAIIAGLAGGFAVATGWRKAWRTWTRTGQRAPLSIQRKKVCPYCNGITPTDGVVCRYCKSDITAADRTQVKQPPSR